MGAVAGRISSEMPAHVVLQRADGYQVWRYPPSVSAVVYAPDLAMEGKPPLTEGPFRDAAFRLLARYIGVFSVPENAAPNSSTPEKLSMTAPVVQTPASQKIAMTAPVVMGPASHNSGESMRFLLPAKYRSVEEAPVPRNKAVKIEMLHGDRVEAVLAFSGNYDMEIAAKRAAELKEFLDRDAVRTVGEWTVQGYNPPFTLPHLKRNEIHYPLDPSNYPVTEEKKTAS